MAHNWCCGPTVAAKLVRPEQIEEETVRYFAQDPIDFALLRFAAYGCYALSLHRDGR
ncbi:hypothetical protein [Microbulbifer sp.]|uniref:hypothetical protein n=1 Tax=Microbulbifer sp. TaxID=1908541 RepID=UPI003F3696F8